MIRKDSLETLLSSPHPFLFLLTPEREKVVSGVASFYENSNEDVEVTIFDTKQMSIPLVKEIQKLALFQTMKKRILVLSFYSFLEEAQNKMLKTLEESHPLVRFIFVTESKQAILPTVLSRAEVTDISIIGEVIEKSFDTTLFLATSKSLRMEIPFVKKILAKKDEDEKKDKEYLTQFLLELMISLPKTNEGMKGKADIVQFLTYTKDSSASAKMMLEYLAFSLPHVIE
jgi:hypothetical protein